MARHLLSRYYILGGDHVIAVHGDSRQALDIMDFTYPCDAQNRAVCAELFLLSGRTQARPSGVEFTINRSGLIESRFSGSFHMDWYGKAQAVISPDTRRAVVTVPRMRRLNPEFLSKMVMRAVLDRLLERSFLLLHAAGASIGNRAFIITGRAGTGKSTLLAELLDSGMDFLADDRIAISRDDPLRILRYPEHIRRPGSHRGPKRRIAPPAAGASSGMAAGIIILEKEDGRLRMIPLSPAETAAWLVRHVPVRDPEMWEANLDAMVTLCGHAKGYLLSGWGGTGERLETVLRLAGDDAGMGGCR